MLTRAVQIRAPVRLCIAPVLRGGSFVVSAKTVVMSTISLFARQPGPLEMFSVVPDGAAWLGHHRNMSADEAQLFARAVGCAEEGYASMLENPRRTP